MGSIEHSTKRNKRKKPASSSRTTWIIFLGGGVLGIAILIGLTGFGATRLENRDAFCASCHTDPETTYYHRSTATPASDLASFHTEKKVRCIDCHSGSGPAGRAAALMLGAKDLSAFLTHKYTSPAPLTRPISDANCLKCHSDVTKKQDFENHFHVFLAQWQAVDPNAATCVSCHQSHDTSGEAGIAYLNRDSTTQVCQTCHSMSG
jgi:predicted CXXCH cytochrome family protein